MRRSRTLVILALALVCGGLAAWATLRLLEQQQMPLPLSAAEPPSSMQVVVAARALNVGDLLAQEDVKLVNWPGSAVPEGYAASVAEVVGRGVTVAVAVNEPLLEAKLADRAGGGGLPIAIPEGMRAISVRVDDVTQVSGYVTAGRRVDILLTVESNRNANSIDRQVTKVVLQNVQVLAVGQIHTLDPQGNPIPASVVTVLVTPEDAEKLILAQNEGRIQMALRNMIDVRDVRTDGARLTELLTGTSRPAAPRRASAPAPVEQPASATTVEVVKGGARALIRF